MPTAAADQVSYADLYARWERGNWRATEIDFALDREQWRSGFTDLERRAALWNYAMFFHGEDAVATDLSPFIDAAPTEEQRYFLATQQADEARHAVLFSRFMHEVVERGDGTIGGGLAATRPELTWGFRKTFALLDRVVDELRRDRSRTKLAQALTMYHLVVEATLAQPGQHFISDYLEARGMLPGFRAGMKNVSNDEQRHIAFGVKLLRDLATADPEVPDAVAEQLRRVTPYSLAVFVPPGWDTRYVECFGFTLEEIYEVAARSFEGRFRAAGLPIESLPGPQVMPMDLPPRQRAERGLAMLRAGYLGERNGAPARDPEAMAMLFDSMRRGIDLRRAPVDPLVLQWEFSDAEPWHLRVAAGETTAAPGRAAHVDVELRCRFDDWIDVIAGRLHPRRAMATGRLRPHGSPRALWRARALLVGS
jgi:Ribonucleotide reductase, small chain/SCP-2 sterol transfer family